jgi:hypothetical protein
VRKKKREKVRVSNENRNHPKKKNRKQKEKIMNKVLDRLLNIKTTTDGLSILGIALTLFVSPDSAVEISSAIATIWGSAKIFQKD